MIRLVLVAVSFLVIFVVVMLQSLKAIVGLLFIEPAF
jgi:hypothetical protein